LAAGISLARAAPIPTVCAPCPGNIKATLCDNGADDIIDNRVILVAVRITEKEETRRGMIIQKKIFMIEIELERRGNEINKYVYVIQLLQKMIQN
jgi:hypothetical protein